MMQGTSFRDFMPSSPSEPILNDPNSGQETDFADLIRNHRLLPSNCVQRVYKKVAPNNKLVLYVENREVVINGSAPPVIRGVVIADSEFLRTHSLFGQLVLVFRYGREDEEVMGLTFSNIIVLQTLQLHPSKDPANTGVPKSPLQESIERHLSACGVAHAFHFQVASCAPPSVSLYPAKSYTGAPLGTSYEVYFFAGKAQSEKPLRRASVRMTVRLCQCPPPASGLQPRNSVFKQFLLSGGKVHLEVSLQREVYSQTDPITFRVVVNNGCKRTVRRIKAEVVQAVDVAMFKSGKFKSVVASVETSDGCPIITDATFIKDFSLQPQVGAFKNWIALEDSPEKGGLLCPSVVDSDVDWNSFAVHVSYYVKVKLLLSGVGGGVSVRVPFIKVKAEHVQAVAEPAPAEKDATLHREGCATETEAPAEQKVAADVHMQVATAISSGSEGTSTARTSVSELCSDVSQEPSETAARLDAGSVSTSASSDDQVKGCESTNGSGAGMSYSSHHRYNNNAHSELSGVAPCTVNLNSKVSDV